MAANSEVHVGSDHISDTFTDSFIETYDDLDENHGTDRDSEDSTGSERAKRGPTINMFTDSMRSRYVNHP